MATGVTGKMWEMSDVVALTEAADAPAIKRGLDNPGQPTEFLMKIGDKVRSPDGVVGVVVCLPATREFAEDYSLQWVKYLETGALVESDEMGRCHWPNLSDLTVITDETSN